MTNRDTSREARRVQLEALRRLGGPGRLEAAIRMTEDARERAIAGVLDRHPDVDLDRTAARAIVIRRILGDELYDAAYSRATPE